MTPSRRLLLRALGFTLAGACFGRGYAQDRYAAAREQHFARSKTICTRLRARPAIRA